MQFSGYTLIPINTKVLSYIIAYIILLAMTEACGLIATISSQWDSMSNSYLGKHLLVEDKDAHTHYFRMFAHD